MEQVCNWLLVLTLYLHVSFVSATGGIDYIPIAHDILFNENTGPVQTVFITVLNDECLENDEAFNVTLTTSLDCVQLADDRLTITIVDDDSEFVVLLILSCSLTPWTSQLGAKVTLSESFITTGEEDSFVTVCVEVKSQIKRSVALQLSYNNISAEGKGWSIPTV